MRPHVTPPTISDGLQRTEWFSPDVNPTISGQYECSTGGGYVFLRIWTGTTWLSPINGSPTSVRMNWRGVKPGSVPVMRYPAAKHEELRASLPQFSVASNISIAFVPMPLDDAAISDNP